MNLLALHLGEKHSPQNTPNLHDAERTAFCKCTMVTSVKKQLFARGGSGGGAGGIRRERDLRPALQVTVAPHQAIILFEK